MLLQKKFACWVIGKLLSLLSGGWYVPVTSPLTATFTERVPARLILKAKLGVVNEPYNLVQLSQ